MKKLFLTMCLAVFLALPTISAFAEPTPIDRALMWDEYTDPDGAGFFLYWAPESENPKIYSDVRRVDVGFPAVADITDKLGITKPRHSVVVIDANPTAKSSLCFQLTAYDLAGNESGYTGEACGWFGLPTATGFSTNN